MKYFFLFALTLFLQTQTAFAQTPTTSTSGTPSPSQKPMEKPQSLEILNDLKEKIASRVAQLNLVEKKALIGTIQSVSGTQITIIDGKGQERFIDVDELTRFSSPTAKDSFGLSDLEKGDTISALGLYNKQSRRILARFINVTSVPKSVHGVITNIDSTNFTITIVSLDEKQTLVGIEKVTKVLSFSPPDTIEKSGFTKISTGQHVVIIGFPDKKDSKKFIASRVLVFTGIPKDPRIIMPQPALNPETTSVPSTGSGIKLSPIKK